MRKALGQGPDHSEANGTNSLSRATWASLPTKAGSRRGTGQPCHLKLFTLDAPPSGIGESHIFFSTWEKLQAFHDIAHVRVPYLKNRAPISYVTVLPRAVLHVSHEGRMAGCHLCGVKREPSRGARSTPSWRARAMRLGLATPHRDQQGRALSVGHLCGPH